MIKVAIIGCGYWGPNLIRNFIISKETNLVWACDLDSERLAAVLSPYPSVKKTTSFDDILTDPQIEGVAIATPVDSHYLLAKSCLEHDKHVLIEKPFVSSSEQGQELLELADKKNLQIMCDHTFCYTGVVRKIKEIIDSGEIGNILYYDSVRVNLGLFQNDVNVIWDLAVHDLAILDFLFDKKPIAVSAHGASHAGNNENIGYLILRYQDSFIAHIHVNWLAPVKIRKTLIGGNKKMIEWNDLVPSEKLKVYDKGINLLRCDKEQEKKMRISYRSGDILSPYIDNTEALSLIVSEFSQCIRKNKIPSTDGRAGLRILKILEAADKSICSQGAMVDLR